MNRDDPAYPAYSRAKTLLFRTAGRAFDAPRDSVEQWDARTGANDARAALSLALGYDAALIDPATGTYR